jgi:hypothetical protein
MPCCLERMKTISVREVRSRDIGTVLIGLGELHGAPRCEDKCVGLAGNEFQIVWILLFVVIISKVLNKRL